MSTTEPVMPGNDSYPEDRTHPTAEILNALSALNNTNPVKTESQEPQPAELQTPPSEYDFLNKQVADNPHDHEAWRRLVDVAEATGDIDTISATYDALLKQFPNTAQAQIQYISHFTTNESMFEKVEVLFNKFLKSSPCVELWNFYLTFVRRLNSAPSQREIVRKSYEFALSHIGQDKDSGHIWQDYIHLIKSGETSTTWEEQQKMDALRKVYHRAVQIPLDNVERLWQDLETFETNLNKITAKKFMTDLSPAHMQARTVLRQLSNHLSSLYLPSPQDEIPLPSLPKFDASDRALVGKWKIYLKWEEGNPLEIDEKEKATFINRVMGVYRKAVVRMRYYTEIWFMAYSWANTVGKHDEALGFLKAGLEANPSSYLLNFAYTEALEIKKDVAENLAEIHLAYEKFLGILRANLEDLEQQVNAPNTNGAAPANPPNGAEPSSQNTSFGSQGSEDKQPHVTELQKQRTEYGLVWIMYMRFARRAEGVKSSRTVFAKARKDRWTPWEVYEADALMEYHSSDDKGIPGRVFEKGLELFGDEIDFVQRYLGFLISINDINNARALFERVIGNFPPERARPLWERWARYEYQYGDLEAALKLEKRMAEVYPVDTPLKRLAQRHIYLGTDAIADRDLGVAFARRSSANSVSRNETVHSVPPSSQASAPPPKRPASPDYRKRDDGRAGDYGGGHKRARAMSPVPGRGPDRDRDSRWEGPSRRRFSPPPPPSGRGGRDPGRSYDREEEKPRPALPSILTWFLGELPNPSSFDGPVFRTDDLMNLFRNAVIPSSSRSKSPPPPPPPRSAGRPPPDYGPYQGPNSGPRRRY